MRILSNSFPTNMPDSEEVSQGGPANFAKQFTNYIATHSRHDWVGLVFNTSSCETTKIRKIYSFKQREYYKMDIPSVLVRSVTCANPKQDPQIIMGRPIKRIVRLIKLTKPDIIFLNGYGIFNWVLLKAGQISGVPTVIQHAGIWKKELDVHRNYYSKNGRKIMEDMEREATKITSHEIFLNEWSKQYYNENVCKIIPKKTSIIPLPFDFVSFKKTSQTDANLFSFDKKQIHFGTIARWDKIKNHKSILEIAKKAKNKKLNWHFHSVVDIPEKYQQEAREYTKYVDVIPPLDRSGIYQFCRSVDILFLPSIFDVSPTVVLEAFAANTPVVISTNIGFGHEFKIFGAKKWVIDFNNINLAMKGIEKIINKKMPKKLVLEIRKSHNSKRVFQNYLKIFNQLTSPVQ